MEVVIVILLAVVAAVYASRVGLPGRSRRLNVAKDQDAFLEEFLPVAEADARQRGMSEDEIAAREAQIRRALPLPPEGQVLEPDGTVVDRRKHVL